MMDNDSGAYDIVDRIRELEYKVEQLEVTVKVLWQVIDKLRPGYNKENSDERNN